MVMQILRGKQGALCLCENGEYHKYSLLSLKNCFENNAYAKFWRDNKEHYHNGIFLDLLPHDKPPQTLLKLTPSLFFFQLYKLSLKAERIQDSESDSEEF